MSVTVGGKKRGEGRFGEIMLWSAAVSWSSVLCYAVLMCVVICVLVCFSMLRTCPLYLPKV